MLAKGTCGSLQDGSDVARIYAGRSEYFRGSLQNSKLLSAVVNALNTSTLPARRLEIEITETAVIELATRFSQI